ncbi:MAG: glycosyltransferase family 2 protein [Flavobacteriaceae bacterium]|jgi:glycosyltransferase involved in cell wall biosynthesis|nr:glycosyltransferase family 2 protein [Flavobacteriaceae bacterium]
MNIYIIIPVFNEEKYLQESIDSIVKQTLLPKILLLVNDSSTDNSEKILKKYSNEFSWIKYINIKSKQEHVPGEKVIRTFYKGLEKLDSNYDVICKFDSDIILPENYLESIINIFNGDSKVGIAGGNLYIKKKNNWVYEKISSKNHVRGPIKSYRKKCFEDIQGLRKSIGWDTVDVLIAQYHGWKIKADKSLIVKHLKPTGANYTYNSKFLQGEALYKMRFGIILSIISVLKTSINTGRFLIIFFAKIGYINALFKRKEKIVTKEQGKFIRKHRWKRALSNFLNR